MCINPDITFSRLFLSIYQSRYNFVSFFSSMFQSRYNSLTVILMYVLIQIQLSLSAFLSLYQSRYNSLTCILKCVFIDTQNYRTLYSLPSNITLTVIKQSSCQLTIFKVYMIQVKMKLTDRSFQRLRNIVIYARHVN